MCGNHVAVEQVWCGSASMRFDDVCGGSSDFQ